MFLRGKDNFVNRRKIRLFKKVFYSYALVPISFKTMQLKKLMNLFNHQNFVNQYHQHRKMIKSALMITFNLHYFCSLYAFAFLT